MPHTYDLIADQGEGDNRSVLERRDDGQIVLSTNAATREPVHPSQFYGPGWDAHPTAEWIEELTEQFGSRDAAVIFVRAAGREVDE